MTRSELGWLILILAVVGSSLFAQPAVRRDPHDLQVVLRSATGSDRFRVGEVISIEVLLSSTSPNRYLEPCALFRESNFGFPQCRFQSHWTFAISPENGWLDYNTIDGQDFGGGQSFEIPAKTLTPQPVTISYFFTNRFRFDKPGEYKIIFNTEIGLNDPTIPLTAHYDPSLKVRSIPVTRELVIHIVPAETEWQQRIVGKGAEAWFGPRPPDTNPPSQSMLDYQQAKRALCAVGTPEAALVFAKALLTFDHDADTCLRRSPSLSVGIDEMQRLLIDPDVAVKTNFFSSLVRFLNIEESKTNGFMPTQDIVDKERHILFSALTQKRGDARAESLATVLQNPPRTKLDESGQAYDLPFPTQVISMAANDFDRLPYQTQKLLLEDGWDSIRSPLMLPTVRRRAELGDGPALLRWRELEPAAASEFIRKEIVRPQPRFSSYYLRLPDTSLPAQENQIAANFTAFADLNDDRGLTHSATLLHRYATAAVLPTVLPFIDAKLTDWPCSIQVPVLAYLLKVSPDQAYSRIEKVLATSRSEVCDGRFITTLGLLEPGPVLQQIAFAEINAGTPSAQDGAEYLTHHAPPELKPIIWNELEKWQRKFGASGAGIKWNSVADTTDERAKQSILVEGHSLVLALTTAFEAAQGWLLTPDDEKQLEALLDPETIKSLRCRFACGAQLSVGRGPYTIISRRNPTTDERDNESQSMEYLNSTERLGYSLNQYRCPNVKALEEKLLQFPSGSTFSFSSDFSERDREELVEISGFLEKHGYKVNNVQNWTFLADSKSQ